MSARSTSLAKFLLNQWRTCHQIAEDLYGQPLDDKKLRAARQSLSRLRETVDQEDWPLDVPAGKALVLDERWEKKADGHGSEKCFRLRMQDAHPEHNGRAENLPSYLQLWLPPSSWSGWIVPAFSTLERDRSINHKHLYTDSRGPDNWLTVSSGAVYQEAQRTAGRAMYEELHGGGEPWASDDLVYIGLGTGSGLADVCVLRELLDQSRGRRIRVVPLDFSPVLLSETVANFYQEFGPAIDAGRLTVHPILGDIEQPAEWAQLLPAVEPGASLVIGMFGNTIGHLQYRERNTIQKIFEAVDGWAARQRCPRWTQRNSRMLLGVSLQRKDGAPHGRTADSVRRWLNLISDPLITLLETVEGEFELVPTPPERQQVEEGREAVGELRYRRDRHGNVLGRIWHEELPYKPSDGITGVVQRYYFAFEADLDLHGQQVFQRHHLPESRWQDEGRSEAHFRAGEDVVVLCEVTQFKLESFRPALRRLGVLHGDRQVHVMKLGNSRPYAVLVFAHE